MKDVFLQRHAFAEMIEAWQHATSIEHFLDDAAKCAAIGCRAPMAKVLELRQEDQTLIVKGQYGLGLAAIGRSAGMIEPDNPPGLALAIVKPVVDADVRRRPAEKIPALLVDYSVATTVNVPLISREGPFGILEVDYREVASFGALEMSFLASVASALSESIEKHLMRMHLATQCNAKDILLHEQQHRIRNNFQLIVGMLQRNALQATDPEVKGKFKDVERRVFSMASLYDHLLGLGDHGEYVDLGRYLETMTRTFPDFYNLHADKITLKSDFVSGVYVNLDVCTAVGTIVNELVANAVEHAFQQRPGNIALGLKQTRPDEYAISVADDGCGLAKNAHENIGLATGRRLAASFGASLDCRSDAAHGTVWTLSFTPGRSTRPAI